MLQACSKRIGTTGKVVSFPQKFTFYRNISALVSEHDIPPIFDHQHRSNSPVICYYRDIHVQFQRCKDIPIKGVDDKYQIAVTLTVSCNGEFLPIQLTYVGKNERSLTKYSFPPSFSVTFTKNHWSNTEKSVEFFKEIIFPYLEDTKRSKSYPLEQHALIIMDIFKG